MAKYLRLLSRIALRTVQAVAFYLVFVALVIESYNGPAFAALDSAYKAYIISAGLGLACAVQALGGVWAATEIFDAMIYIGLRLYRRRATKAAGKAIIVALVAALALPGVASAQDGQPLAIVTAPALNVRAGPGADQPVIGQLARGGRLRLSGVSNDGGWYFFRYWDQDGWIAAPFVRVIEGDPAQLAIVILEPVAPLPPSGARVTLADVVVDPAVPRPGQPFRVALTLKNEGESDAGVFSVASVLNSGWFAFQTVQRLGAGQSGTVTLEIPGEQATGHFESTLIVDVERQIAMSEADRVQTLAYSIDQPYIAQSETRIERFANVDLHGGRADLAYSDNALVALDGAKIELLSDVTISDLHFDALEKLRGSTVPDLALTPGAILGVQTVEGRRGWLRVVSRDGDALRVQYAVYAR